MSDIRYALRGFRRSPGFTLAAILSLALGIGANTAIFSLVNVILLRTLPVREPNRLVLFTWSTPDRYAGSPVGPELYQQIRDKNTVLDGFVGVANPQMTLSGGGMAERVNGQSVSGNFFGTLGVNATIGRVLTPEDDRIPEGPPVCVISYALWTRRFGGDPAVIGRKILINAQPFTVLGVTPKAFAGISQGAPTDVSVPLHTAGMYRRNMILQTFGRLKTGVSVAEAQASLDVLFHQLNPQQPNMPAIKIVLRPGGQGLGGLRSQYERPLLMLMVVVGLVLLIACANVTNLLMARASSRAREIAVRLAVGATRRRLVRQFLSESLMLSAGGALLGMAVAFWVDRALVALAPRQWGGAALIIDVNPDWRVLLFTLGVAMMVSVLSGIAPAIQSTSETRLRGPGRFSFLNAMVVAQVALSLVLLVGAGLFLRSLRNLKSIDPGFNPEHMVVMTIQPALSGYSQAASQEFFDTLVDRARRMPGVISASPSNVSPLSGDYSLMGILVPGSQHPNERQPMSINWVGPDYFKTLGTPLAAGRAFTKQDGRTNQVAMVNEKFAAHFWARESALGTHVVIGRHDEFEIVGVVKDVKSASLREDAEATVYLPFRLNTIPHITLHVRAAGNTAPVIPALLRAIQELDPNLAAYNVTTMDAQLDGSIALDRLMATLMALFGLLAVVLAAVGLYGVMAFTVAARTREIGIRMALGAGHGRVLMQVMSESAILTLTGISIGVPSALWASRAVGSFLYGLTATDPWTYTVLAALLAGIALSAAWIPARRAALVDPMVALRSE
jgi:predicted permease